MKISFSKYHGTGNDFIMIDDRENKVFPKLSTKIIKQLCTRRFGIGADGLILLKNDPQLDFKMVYYNADGGESTMCGNGGRCLVHFAKSLKVFKSTCLFNAIDGLHEGKMEKENVFLKMGDVHEIVKRGKAYEINTGSPHYIKFVEGLSDIDVYKAGSRIRNGKSYAVNGINVNFVEKTDRGISVRTYERGVEDETFSCGTGVVASTLATVVDNNLRSKKVTIKTLGGKLKVTFKKSGAGFDNIWLIGPATHVSSGEVDVITK